MFFIEESSNLHHREDRIPTPESLEAVNVMINHLGKLVTTAQNKTDFRSQVYQRAAPGIATTQEIGRAIIQMDANDQDLVHIFFARASGWIDLPKKLEKAIIKNEDWGQILESRIADADYLPDHKRLRSAKDYEMDLRGENFQNKVIFKLGVLPYFTLIKDRENAVSYLGVALSDTNNYDRRTGSSYAFTQHDLQHSLFQKTKDAELFKYFSAVTLDQQRAVKKKTNDLFQNRIEEMNRIIDPELKDAVLAALFFMLHETSESYPLGVNAWLNPPSDSRTNYLLTSIKNEVEIEPQFEYLMDRPEKIILALKWIAVRAQEDSKELKLAFGF